MHRITLTLPLPPSVNVTHARGDWITRKDGRRVRNLYATPAYASWKDEAGWRINEARAKGAFKPLPHGHWLAKIRWPADMRLDGDNPVKPLLDLLVSMHVTPDDAWLWWHGAGRSRSVEKGTCRVSVWSTTR